MPKLAKERMKMKKGQLEILHLEKEMIMEKNL